MSKPSTAAIKVTRFVIPNKNPSIQATNISPPSDIK